MIYFKQSAQRFAGIAEAKPIGPQGNVALMNPRSNKIGYGSNTIGRGNHRRVIWIEALLNPSQFSLMV